MQSNLNFSNIRSAFACALHMHQPVIPAGRDGALISNLQAMLESGDDGERYNAERYIDCYGRMGEIIPELVAGGLQPRIMLDYSGNLLWGLEQMGRDDVIGRLRLLAVDPAYYGYVEWLGTMWSHAVVSSTPVADISLHVKEWRNHFAELFGREALARVKGFSPPEMHLPNHPDVLYHYINSLKDNGYEWLLVQQHSVERADGSALEGMQLYLPNRLIALDSQGRSAEITVLIKTQGSDTKLVGQMQPLGEARNFEMQKLGSQLVPACSVQIADGENGGVMMNEFPQAYRAAIESIRGHGTETTGVCALNGSEYLALLKEVGVQKTEFPVCQARGHHKIHRALKHSANLEEAIAAIQSDEPGFKPEGHSWTDDISWESGYENVTDPIERLSAAFHRKYGKLLNSDDDSRDRDDFQKALRYNLLLQTSCFRYWGQGQWTDYAREIYRRAAVEYPELKT